jgi:predicted transporter
MGIYAIFLGFVVPYVHVRRISILHLYLPSPSLFSYAYFTILIVILIPIVYLELEVRRLSREVSPSLYMYSYA